MRGRILIALIGFGLVFLLAGPRAEGARQKRVLFIMTSAHEYVLRDGTVRPTGFWAEEFAEPYQRFTDAGYEVDLASLKGRPSQPDPASLQFEQAVAHSPDLIADDLERYAHVLAAAQTKLDHPIPLAFVTPDRLRHYQAIFVPGGHAPMEDLATSPVVGRVIENAYRLHILLSAVCHGVAAFLPAHRADDRWLFRGYRMTAYSNAEESTGSPAARGLPFYLQDALTNGGARYSSADNLWAPHVVDDRLVVTGQNPASSAPLARQVLLHLEAPPR